MRGAFCVQVDQINWGEGWDCGWNFEFEYIGQFKVIFEMA
jgi:hypothetical protein